MERDMSAMERLRADLIRRARAERHGDVEQGVAGLETNGRPDMQERGRDQPSRSLTGRPLFPRLFRRGQTAHLNGRNEGDEIESPKSPDSIPIASHLPLTQPISSITRTLSDGSGQTRNQPQAATTQPVPSPHENPTLSSPPSNGQEGAIQTPQSATEFQPQPPPRAQTSWFGYHSPDPAEVQLAHIVEERRRRRQRERGTQSRDRRSPPKKFLFCFPWIKSRRIRGQILQCFVSGMFLALLLAVYLALSVTKNINTGELTIILIIVMLFATVFFCHGLIRLCILVVRGDRREANRARLPNMFGPGGYAVPAQPIPVVLARDEEAAGIESEATKSKPPAYGLWRESVRVDPDRLFWQRNATAAEPVPHQGQTNSGPRPPSYASDDGVSYVVEAVPRSTAPTADVPLPPHPAERGFSGGRLDT